MENLKEYLNSIIQFSEKEMVLFTTLFSDKQLKKNDYFANEGEYSTKLAFLKEGVMRAFYRNKGGKEYNKTFFTNSNFVGAYSSLVTQQKNLINIQCLTDCTFQVCNYENVIKLYNEYPKIERLARKLAETKFSIKEKREIELVTLDASKRYLIFKKEHPNLENLIPQYHIASYLGISATQLSRIRTKK